MRGVFGGGGALVLRSPMADAIPAFRIGLGVQCLRVVPLMQAGVHLDVLRSPQHKHPRSSWDRSGPPLGSLIAVCRFGGARFLMIFRIMLACRFWFIWRWEPSCPMLSLSRPTGWRLNLRDHGLPRLQFGWPYWQRRVMFVVVQTETCHQSAGFMG